MRCPDCRRHTCFQCKKPVSGSRLNTDKGCINIHDGAMRRGTNKSECKETEGRGKIRAFGRGRSDTMWMESSVPSRLKFLSQLSYLNQKSVSQLELAQHFLSQLELGSSGSSATLAQYSSFIMHILKLSLKCLLETGQEC